MTLDLIEHRPGGRIAWADRPAEVATTPLHELLRARPGAPANGETAGPEHAASRALEASTLVHDLKAPLTVIRAQAQLLRRALEREAGAELAGLITHRLGLIDAAATRMAAALDELLDPPGGRADPTSPTPAAADLVALARAVAEEARLGVGAPDVRVEAEADGVVGPWDGARLRRVVENLVGNAVKYSPSGRPITLAVARELDRDGTWGVLRVRDQGRGIPAAELPRLFEPYFRASNALGRVDGTGLGLAGARQIVERHGGRLLVESREAEGSTFTVRLPLVSSLTPAPADGQRVERRS